MFTSGLFDSCSFLRIFYDNLSCVEVTEDMLMYLFLCVAGLHDSPVDTSSAAQPDAAKIISAGVEARRSTGLFVHSCCFKEDHGYRPVGGEQPVAGI